MSEEILSRGDWIFHANYGIGQIRGKDQKVLEGDKREFYRVVTFNGEYWLPLRNADADHIRPVSSETQIKRALSLIRKLPKPLPKDYKRRGKQVLEAARDISIYSKARVLRDLNGRRQAGTLNQREKDIFDLVKKQILDEWAVVREDRREILRQKLEKALKLSVEKLNNGDDPTWLEKVRKGVKERRNPIV